MAYLNPLYLDTARIGIMTVGAKAALFSLAELARVEPTSLHVERILRNGTTSVRSWRGRFPNLTAWQGVGALKKSLRTLLPTPGDWHVLLSSRSVSLVKLVASYLFQICSNVLTTDLSWPTYQRVIEQHANRTRRRVTIVSLRNRILHQGWTARDVATHLAAEFVKAGCDSVFLPAVDHLGIWVPIEQIVRRIKQAAEVRFSFVDAAQAFGQVPLDDLGCADAIISGASKWLGAYLPLGLGFLGSCHAREIAQHLLRRRCMVDPLLQITEQTERGQLDGFSETANLSPLFTCAGAIADLTTSKASPITLPLPTLENVQRLVPMTEGWWPLLPASDMRSRIMLFQAPDSATRSLSPSQLRRRWLSRGYIVSGYSRGLVRLSLRPGRTSSAHQQSNPNVIETGDPQCHGASLRLG